jgi:hypothetical protein
MLIAAKAAGQITRGGDRRSEDFKVEGNDFEKVTLSDTGISRDLSSRAQQLASIPKLEFQAKLEQELKSDRTFVSFVYAAKVSVAALLNRCFPA